RGEPSQRIDAGESEVHGRERSSCEVREHRMADRRQRRRSTKAFEQQENDEENDGGEVLGGEAAHSARYSVSGSELGFGGSATPMTSRIDASRASRTCAARPSRQRTGASGSANVAVPICTAEAPAIKNSSASSVDVTPPAPMIGIETRCAT